ncbi:LysE family translocator [Streptomyces sp. NPDC056144]|uniref:LysE family translocator n=1 Tax=unclassified Streptomyces TaxID=2593676 RepID=UPI0035D5C49F
MISGIFLASSLLVIVVPGPDAALITRLALGGGGRARPLSAAAGMITAGALQAAASILGVSLLLTTDSTLFRVVQWTGAALLVYWGVRAVIGAVRTPATSAPPTSAPPTSTPTASPPPTPDEPSPPRSLVRTYLHGLACTGTNPKVGLFLLAFLPQFVPAGEPPGRSMAVLAAVYLTIGALWLVVLTEAMVRIGTALDRRHPSGRTSVTRWVELGLGLVFIGFGVRLALGV